MRVLKVSSPAYLAIGVISLIWGTTFLALSFGLDSLPPLFVSGGRQMISGILILLFCFYKGYRIPKWEFLKQVFLSGFLMVMVSNSFVTWSLNYVSSGMATVLFTLAPVFIAVIAIFVLRTEKINRWIAIGLLMGLLGLVALSWSGIARPDRPSSPIGLAALLIGILGWSIGTIVSKKISEQISPFFIAGIQLFVFGLLMFAISFAVEDISMQSIQPKSLWAIGYLIVFDSIIGYGCYMYALSKVPATVASLYAYIAPVVAVLAGWSLRNEKITLVTVLSSILILTGVFIVEKGYSENKSDY
jgi:drug/metabolite transporter (DMT)-like permease